MTQLLEKALSEISKLDEPEQDALASILLEEIASEERWSRLFDESQDILSSLADEALAEHAAGRRREAPLPDLTERSREPADGSATAEPPAVSPRKMPT